MVKFKEVFEECVLVNPNQDDDDVFDFMFKVLVPLTIVLMSTSMTASRLQWKDKLTRNLGGVFLQEVAVLDSGCSMPESLFKTF